MPLDYSHQDLQGSDFKGRDLAGTNFSHADVRGANFTDAILTDANFTEAKAGLQHRWVRGLVIASLFPSLLSGAFAGFTGFFC